MGCSARSVSRSLGRGSAARRRSHRSLRLPQGVCAPPGSEPDQEPRHRTDRPIERLGLWIRRGRTQPIRILRRWSEVEGDNCGSSSQRKSRKATKIRPTSWRKRHAMGCSARSVSRSLGRGSAARRRSHRSLRLPQGVCAPPGSKPDQEPRHRTDRPIERLGLWIRRGRTQPIRILRRWSEVEGDNCGSSSQRKSRKATKIRPTSWRKRHAMGCSARSVSRSLGRGSAARRRSHRSLRLPQGVCAPPGSKPDQEPRHRTDRPIERLGLWIRCGRTQPTRI
ncbi:hypothetical protein R3P38DRAFT_475720 [Favolaschia claudopus]|uniref:Uncharacterized protein n=1 Tax=Favolaschia claudopus TaxID=2862362 RepID=A0AAW0CJD6_9AGAR